MSYECRQLAEYYFMSQFERYLLFAVVAFNIGQVAYMLMSIYRRK